MSTATIQALQVIENTCCAARLSDLARKVRNLREALDEMVEWKAHITGSAGHAHPARAQQLGHYGVVYKERIEKFRAILMKDDDFVLMKSNPKLEGQLFHVTDLSWVDDYIMEHMKPSDVRGFGEFMTMYTLNPNEPVVAVGSLHQIEDLAESAKSPIWELKCQTSNYEMENGLFLVSRRQVQEQSRYR